VKLSVLLTTFNHERHVSEALDSVLMQRTRFPFEVLVGDDLSTDGTRGVITAYARAHPERVVPVLPDTKPGLEGGLLFKALLERARGEHLALLDGDDVWLSEHKLQRQVDVLDAEPGCALCFHDAIAFFDDGRLPAWNLSEGHPRVSDVTEMLGTWNRIASSSVVLRNPRPFVLPDWLYASTCIDWGLYVFAALRGTVVFLEERMSAYRLHAGGMWSGLDRRAALAEKATFHAGLRASLPAEYGGALEYARVKLATLVAVAQVVEEPGAVVLVASRGDEELVELGGLHGRHFPADEHGWFAGEYPADDREAIDLVERERRAGAAYLVFPRPAAWWLAHYEGLAQHLDERYERAWDAADCVVFRLTALEEVP
jgi:hypothetical protein